MRKTMRSAGKATAHKVCLRQKYSGGFMGQWQGTWTVVHELAHAWDAANGWNLSEQLEHYTGGKTKSGIFRKKSKYKWHGTPPKGANAHFTRREDFAESITAFIYPAKAQAFISSIYGSNPDFQYTNYYHLPRAAFVAQLVNMAPQAFYALGRDGKSR